MPLTLKTQTSQSVSIAAWHIEETEEFFLNSLQLFPDDKENIRKIKLPQVRLQKLACRATLSNLLGSNEVGITYTETGQPHLNNFYISFSHTENTVAAALASIPIGIDIEELNPRILRLYPRFMSKNEIADSNFLNFKELYYYWCSKEAMYKWFAEKNLDFIEDLLVFKNENKGVVCKKHTVQLKDYYFENHIIVVCF